MRKPSAKLKYPRVLIKLSGEALASPGQQLDRAVLERTCAEVAAAVGRGCQVGLVVGGGNIFRGLAGSRSGVDRVTGDQMGMLATVINALALRNFLELAGLTAEVMTSVPIGSVGVPFNAREARRRLAAGEVVIFAGGTGNPFFTTDTAAALRAVEIQADALMKATKVDGVYSADPKRDPKAKKFARISCTEVIARQLGVMDLTAITLCRENRLPALVFSMAQPGNIVQAVRGRKVGTIVEGE